MGNRQRRPRRPTLTVEEIEWERVRCNTDRGVCGRDCPSTLLHIAPYWLLHFSFFLWTLCKKAFKRALNRADVRKKEGPK